MRMTGALIAAMVLAAGGCSEKSAGPIDAAADSGSAAAGNALTAPPPAPAEPSLPAPVPVAPVVAPEASSAAVLSRCPSEPGSYCSGPLIVRAEQAVLSKVGREFANGMLQLNASVRYTIENRTDHELLVNIPSDRVYLTLGNGTILASNTRYDGSRSGVTPCTSAIDTCRQGQIGDFLKLTPGESPARFQLFFSGRSDASVRNTIETIKSGETALDMFVLTPGEAPLTVKISLSDMVIRNQLAP